MNDRQNNLFEFLVILIKHANDEDIKQLLINSGVKNVEKSKISEQDTYKSLLLELFVCAEYNARKNAKFNIEKEQNKKIKDYEYNLLFCHLISLCENYYTFAIKYKAGTYITRVLHILIDSYTKNHFYYEYAGKIFRTKEIVGSYLKLPHIETVEYKLVNESNKSKLINKETRKEIKLKYLLPNVYKDKKDYVIQETITFEAFENINIDIIEALKKEVVVCSWCAPIDEYNVKLKCDNCKNLLSALNNLKSKIEDDKLKNVDFNNMIKAITLKNCKNDVNECRIQRKQALLKYIDKVKQSTQKYKRDIKNIHMLINNSFEK